MPFFHVKREDKDNMNDSDEEGKSGPPKEVDGEGIGDGQGAERPENEGGDIEAADGADKKSDDREGNDEKSENESIVSETASQIDFNKYN